MRISVLGPLRVEGEHGEVALPAAKERALLAALALQAGRVVSADALVDAVWGDGAPESSRKTLQTYVSNLRRALGADTIGTEAPGYVLHAGTAEVDVAEFAALVHDGEEALRVGRPSEAASILNKAMTLWRGDPFAGVPSTPALAGEAVRLEERRLAAVEARLAADLSSGRHSEIVGELEVLVREHPYRERIWVHLMTALYRCGRQREALEAFQRARTCLHDDLGLEPGPDLDRMERAVLRHDPDLEAPSRAPTDGPYVAPHALTRGSAIDSQLDLPVRYAECADGVRIAYQVVGDGPVDVVFMDEFGHLDITWEDAPADRLVRRLARFTRLILFDKRGTGLSDRPDQMDIENWSDDMLAVLDAVGSDRAVVMGVCIGAPTAAVFAAAHPERTLALVLYAGFARLLNGDGFEQGIDPVIFESVCAHLEAQWGTGVMLHSWAPSAADQPGARHYWARYQRLSASPSAVARFFRAQGRVDIRHVLPVLDRPTLVIHATGDQVVPVEAGRYMAERIPGARFVEVGSGDHLLWFSDSVDDVVDAVEDFIVGAVPDVSTERVLATVLAAVADPWGPSIDGAFRMVVERFRGRALTRPGHATFDGPARAIRAAAALLAEIDGSVQMRVGLHSGECHVVAGQPHGVSLDLAARVALDGSPGEVRVSQTVRDLVVGSGIDFWPRGERCFDGIPDEWAIYAVAAPALNGS